MRSVIKAWASLSFAFAASIAAPALATAPANDNWANATVIGSLPFSTSEPNMSAATVEGTDPAFPCLQPLANPATNTLWYTYTTGANVEYVTLQAPDAGGILAIIAVYTGAPGAFAIVSGGCSDNSSDTHSARIAGLRLAPNTTYSIEVAAVFPVSPSNTLNFTIDAAHQYLVGKTTDSNRASCSGDCSLREAISASNADPGAVIVPAGTYTLTGLANETANASGDLDVTQGMGIYGAGMEQTIVDANHVDRVLLLDPARAGHMAFAIGDLTLTNGTTPAAGAGQPFYATYGGGLCAPNGNGVDDFVGLERIAVTASTAADGGGIELLGPGTIRDSWIANNTATTYYGGGLSVSADSSRRVSISGSTISGNTVTGASGGGMSANGSVSVVNSTITGNSARAYGGGIYYSGFSGGLAVASSTIVFNTAFYNNAAKTAIGAGVFFDGAGTNSMVDSIVAYSTGGDPTDERDCYLNGGTLTASYNLVQYPNNCPFTAGDTHIDPKVLPGLLDRGGPTPTLTIDPNGPAHDSGDPSGCKDPDGLPLAWDQRGPGFPRIDGPQCDKGAFEWIDRVFRNGFD